MVADPSDDDAPAHGRGNREFLVGQLQSGLATWSSDGPHIRSPRAAEAVDEPFGGLTGLGTSSIHIGIEAIAWDETSNFVDWVPRLFPCWGKSQVVLPPEAILPAWRAAVLAYRRVYRTTPEDRLARPAAFKAFRQILPHMPENEAKVQANHAIAYAAANHTEWFWGP
jgi:hypothetical protein